MSPFIDQVGVALRLDRGTPRLRFRLLQRRLGLPELEAGIAIVEPHDHVGRH